MNQFMFVFAFLFAFTTGAPLAHAEESTGGEVPKVEAKSTADDTTGGTADDTTDGELGTSGTGGEVSNEKLLDQGKTVAQAVKDHELALALSAGIMLLLGLGRKFKLLSKLPKNAVPWVSAGLGVLAVLAESLVSGGQLTLVRVGHGLLAGAAASGLWGMLGKHLMAKKTE